MLGAEPSLLTPPRTPAREQAPLPASRRKEFSGSGRFNGAPSSPLHEAEPSLESSPRSFPLTKHVIHHVESMPHFGRTSEVGARAAREHDGWTSAGERDNRLQTHAGATGARLNISETQQILAAQPQRRSVLARNRLEHSNLVSVIADSPMYASDAERLQTSTLVRGPQRGGGHHHGAPPTTLWPATLATPGPDKQRKQGMFACTSSRKQSYTRAEIERLSAREIREDLVAAANNEAKARLQLSALRLNKSAMHAAADERVPDVFAAYATHSNLGVHANP